MDLFEDKSHLPLLKWANQEKTSLIYQEETFLLPLILTEERTLKKYSALNLPEYLKSIELSKLDLVVVAKGNKIESDLFSQCQKICFLNDCGFEWINTSQSIETINVLLEDRRKFIALIL